ncbi:hypothetical protein ALC57_08809, partial [Trachymyrmex cornetzi]
LLLSDLKGLFSKYKEENKGFLLSFSKFAQLRPKHCILMGAAGTHSVCVCTLHQNVKLMLDAINVKYLSQQTDKPIADSKDSLQQIMCENRSPNCHLDDCTECPGILHFSIYMLQLLHDNNILNVTFSNWTSTDRSFLHTQILDSEEFVEQLSEKLMILKPHALIAKQQIQYFEYRKANLCAGEVLVTLDFSENFKYVVQNASQGFHYNNDQCTVFTVVYYFLGDGELKHKSLVFLSDSTTHNAAAVYTIQGLLLPEIKKHVEVKKIIYFSDGAKQHFKNRFQICNLMNHEQDFNVTVEWHFHATSHGKNACDRVGAVFKREAVRESLLAKQTEAILNPTLLYNWGKKNFKV